jgi:NAD-dependent SIR2 family protein deacetylase
LVSESQDNLKTAAAAIQSAEALLIGAGAGIGVDSGLPDFRGTEGFWSAYPPFKKLGLSFTKLANPYWFRSDPELAWGFYGHRRNLYRRTQPHAGYAILRRWAERTAAGSFVFTSNVDGHFQNAGFRESQLVECHGSLEFLQCVANCQNEIWQAGSDEVTVAAETLRAAPPLPGCPRCGGLARPNVLMFNDYEWLEYRTGAQHERYRAWRREIGGRRLVVIELGAGTAIPTVRLECESASGTLIRINPREPEVPERGISIQSGALEVLSAIEALLERTPAAEPGPKK